MAQYSYHKDWQDEEDATRAYEEQQEQLLQAEDGGSTFISQGAPRGSLLAL